MVRKLNILFVAIAALLFFSADALAVLSVEGRYWFSNLDGTVKSTSAGIAGTDIDLVNTLGMESSKDFLEGRITLDLGNHRLRYAYIPMKWTGSKTISQSVVFNGTTYSASTKVDSELKLNYHRLSYEYDVINTLDNRLGLILDVKYLDQQARLKASALGFDKSESIKVPVPAIGLAAQVGLPYFLTVGGEVTGITVGKKAYLVDGEAGVNFKPIPLVTVSGGYRYFRLHIEKNDNKGDLTIDGPFVMLRAGF